MMSEINQYTKNSRLDKMERIVPLCKFITTDILKYDSEERNIITNAKFREQIYQKISNA